MRLPILKALEFFLLVTVLATVVGYCLGDCRKGGAR